MDIHRQVAEGVFETTHGNGERVVVNYGESPYPIAADKVVPPRAYRLLRNWTMIQYRRETAPVWPLPQNQGGLSSLPKEKHQ